MLLSILGFISGLAGPIASIAGKIFDLQQAKLVARTDVEKSAIQQQIDEVHDKQAVLVAEAQSRTGAILNSIMRGLLAIPVAIILWKFLAWDKTVGSFMGCSDRGDHGSECSVFITDPLDPNMWWVIMGVVGFYFLTTWKRNG